MAAFVLAWQIWSPTLEQPGEAQLAYPVETLHYMSETDLLFFDRIAVEAPGWRSLYEFAWGTREDSLAYYVNAYQDLLAWLSRSPVADSDVELVTRRLAILAGEAGDAEALQALTLQPGGFATTIAYVYGGAADRPTSTDLEAVRAALEDGWFLQTLWTRLAEKTGDMVARQQQQAQLQQRGEAILARSHLYQLFINLPVMLTLLVLAGFVLRWRPGRPFMPAPLAPQGRAGWPLNEGIALWVRSEFWVMLYFFAVVNVAWWLPLLYQWATLFSALPGLWLIQRYLLGPRDLDFVSAWGLSPRRFGWSRLLGWVCVVVALDMLGSFVIQAVSAALQLEVAWTEGVSETLLWGEPPGQFLEVTETIVWAPLLEEILFRGVLFVSLLSVMRAVPAALLSGLMFAVLHFYSVTGTVELLWSSLVWAVAFERSRSLLPAICAHSILNIQWVALWLVLY